MPRQLRSALHHSHLFLLTAVVATTFVTSRCAQVGKPPAPVSLTKILGGQDALWRATTPIKVDDPDYRVVEIDGQPAVVVGPNGLDLATAEPLTRDTEIRAVLQFTSPKDVGTKVHIYAGSKKINATDPDSPLATGLTIHPGPSYAQKLYWGTGRMPGQKEPPSGIYYSRNLPRDRLAWPELTRRRVEQEAGAEPMLEQRWFTLRYILRKNVVQVYLDDRLLRDGRDPTLDTTGHFRLRLFDNMRLASLRLRELPPEEPRFETVPLAGYVNAGQFQGQALKREGLPSAVEVAGVKFALPVPDAKGRDHVDLHPSWLRCGLLEGGFDAVRGDAARWRGAMSPDPARIQFRVRNGPYTKLHLLAAFTGEPDTTPVVTAQFYRAGRRPSGQLHRPGAALYRTGPGSSVAGPTGQRRPGESAPGHDSARAKRAAAFSDQDHLEFELTKEVRIYRCFPDPMYYSSHAAGLPSGVHVFAITLERPAVEVDFQPDKVAHIWTAPAQPSYTAKLRNSTSVEQAVELQLTTTSHDGLEKTTVRQTAKLAPGAEQAVKLPLQVKKHGHHDVELKIQSAGETRTQKRSLAYLHPDTRERGNWEEGKGPIFGMWDWNGGHLTIKGMDRLRVMAALGVESSMGSFVNLPKEEQDFLASIGAKSFFLAYQLTMDKDSLGGKEWDPSKPAEMQEALIKWLKSQKMAKPSKINQPDLAVFFAEPMLGPVSYMSSAGTLRRSALPDDAGGTGRLQEIPGPVPHCCVGHQEGMAQREVPDAVGHSQFPDPVPPRKQGGNGFDGRPGPRPDPVRAHAGDADATR